MRKYLQRQLLKLSELMIRAHVNLLKTDPGPLLKKDRPRNRFAALFGGVKCLFLSDGGADYSVISTSLLPSSLRQVPLKPWKGVDIYTALDQKFEIKGLLESEIELNGQVKMRVKFVVVDDEMSIPILGLDWQEHYKVRRDWDSNTLKWQPYGSHEVMSIPLINPSRTTVKLVNQVTIKAGHEQMVEVVVPGITEGTDWMVEPVVLTSGSLRTTRQLVKCHKANCLSISIANFNDFDVTVKKASLWERVSFCRVR